MFARIDKATCLGEHQLSLEFSDGLIRKVEIHRGLGGVFGGLDDEELFSQVSVDPTTGTLVWPGGLDLDQMFSMALRNPRLEVFSRSSPKVVSKLSNRSHEVLSLASRR